MTEEYFESKSSGLLQQKVWNIGELQTIRRQQNKRGANGKIQHKYWDPSILNMEYYDQEVIFISSQGV